MSENEAPEAEEAQVDPIENEKPQELTPEEQMALYEESLKESDWGHQPC